MLNSQAITKVQATLLAVIIVVATVGGGVAYVLLSGTEGTGETIKIGLCADLNMPLGKDAWQGLVLAAEQINAEGGLLDRQIEVVGEDSDSEEKFDPATIITAFNRLLSYHKVDFVIGAGGEGYLVDAAAENEIIMLGTAGGGEHSTQRVLDDYDKYKYFFRACENDSARMQKFVGGSLFIRELTGFTKVARLATNYGAAVEPKYEQYRVILEDSGFDVVYDGRFNEGTVDFGSYFAAAEAAGAEIMMPEIMTPDGISFIKEWYDRQSPMLLWGTNYVGSGNMQSWEWTEGKCVNTFGAPWLGYPVTTKSVPMEEAYFEMWGTYPSVPAKIQYDALRFILFDAIKRAGTTETESVIKALEETSIETSLQNSFRFTSNHDNLYGLEDRPPIFQWQADGKRVPVYPPELMEEAGATVTFPDWPGPWD
jgi:branched-chain amino acid transport system substrate-binding protein